jgi:hypothetical protein
MLIQASVTFLESYLKTGIEEVRFDVNILLVVVSQGQLLVKEIMFNFRKKVNILKDHARLQGADKTKYKMV